MLCIVFLIVFYHQKYRRRKEKERRACPAFFVQKRREKNRPERLRVSTKVGTSLQVIVDSSKPIQIFGVLMIVR